MVVLSEYSSYSNHWSMNFNAFDMTLFAVLSCPFDRIQVYDGESSTDPLIGPFCGQKRGLVLYSFGENLLVVFKSMPRNTDHHNRGYMANYEFSDRFVNLGKLIKKP